MTTAAVADCLRVHPATVYKLLRPHHIPAIKVGSDWRFNKYELDKWMARKTIANKAITGPQRVILLQRLVCRLREYSWRRNSEKMTWIFAH